MNDQAIQEARARSAIYSLLSAAFVHPDEDLVPHLQEGLSRSATMLGSYIDGEGSAVRDALASICSQDLSPHVLQTDYRHAFGHTISQECPPYETEFGSAHVFQQAQRLADIAGFYRAFGLEISDQAKERPDHIAVELEFMSFLTLKEAYALRHHGEEKALICRDAQRKFLDEHLGRWASPFAELLRRKVPSGFYHHVATALDAFTTTECRRLGARPFVFHPNDVTLSPQGLGEGCPPCGRDNFCAVEGREEEA